METIKEAEERGATPQNDSDIPKDMLVSVCSWVHVRDPICPIQHYAFLKAKKEKKRNMSWDILTADDGLCMMCLSCSAEEGKKTHLIPTVHSSGRQAIGSGQSLISWEISPRGWLLDLDEESVQLTDITWRTSSYFEMESALRPAFLLLKCYRINSNALWWFQLFTIPQQ